MPALTIEEAKTLDSFYKNKNIAKTAHAMGKANSAIVYALDSIEEKSGIKLFDRSGYRTVFLPAGERVWEGCQKLLAASENLKTLCQELSQGWESDLRLIVEGVVPLEPMIQGIKSITQKKSSTRFHLQAEFMGDVEDTFLKTGAHLMISVLPPEKTALSSVALFPVPAFLVATRGHDLVREGKVSTKTLRSFPILTVRGSSPRLHMSTGLFESESRIQFNDFHSKKIAVLNGLGYGWLPEYMIRDELKSGKLELIEWEKTNRHLFRPHLYHRGEARLGRSSKLLIEFLSKIRSC